MLLQVLAPPFLYEAVDFSFVHILRQAASVQPLQLSSVTLTFLIPPHVPKHSSSQLLPFRHPQEKEKKRIRLDLHSLMKVPFPKVVVPALPSSSRLLISEQEASCALYQQYLPNQAIFHQFLKLSLLEGRSWLSLCLGIQQEQSGGLEAHLIQYPILTHKKSLCYKHQSKKYAEKIAFPLNSMFKLVE